MTIRTIGELTDAPIAVIGMSCRFPQASSIAAFWSLLCNGVDAVTEVPAQRWDVTGLYSPEPTARGKMHTKWGGFLEQVDQFDAQFFSISPRETTQVDPQQRLMLELSWEALEDAGIAPHSLQDSLTGVFFGAMWDDYGDVPVERLAAITQHTATGQNASTIPARVSYTLGLRGPSVAFNTSCSSALVAVHYARRSLQLAECSLALAGGVNLLLAPESMVAMAKLGALSPDGRSKAFDARANGYARGEGGGVVVLKPLAQATADGDPVRCIILGSAVNNNGLNNGLTAPSQQAQERLLRTAYADARVAPHDVQYVETHGTGTSLGDPMEAAALGTVLGMGRAADQPLFIGSVKTNIGHLESASGIAGLIKTALALQHQTIPANLHFQQPNPRIPFAELRLRVPTALVPWPTTSGRSLAGVSSFGFGGTNGHVVIAGVAAEAAVANPVPESGKPLLLPLSAHTLEALRAQARQYAEHLRTHPEQSARDIAYTTSVRRSHLGHRLSAVGSTKQEWIEQLQAFGAGKSPGGLTHGAVPGNPPRKLVFVFPGQGGQWLGMGKQLLAEEPVFRQRIWECDQEMRQYCDWSLLQVLEGVGSAAELARVDVIQPAVFAMQVGLSALFKSWGVEPDAVVGHSLGEVAAAQVGGWLSLAAACRVICQRSQLVHTSSGAGAMAMVELAEAEARQAVSPYGGRLTIGAVNGPRTTILSGDRSAVEEVLATLDKAGVYCRLVKVDYASHSPQMDKLLGKLESGLAGLSGRAGEVPLYSTVTGQRNAAMLEAEYWARNLREPVQFYAAVKALAQDGMNTFLELGPHPILISAVAEALHETVPHLLTAASLRRDHGGAAELLTGLGELFVKGYGLDWRKLHPQGGRVVALPSYPWQRSRYWFAAPERRSPSPRTPGGHPLLGLPIQLSTEPGVFVFEQELDLTQLPYLGDHRLREAVVLPGTAYLEMARAAGEIVFKNSPGAIEGVTLHELMTLSPAAPKTVQVVVRAETSARRRFEITSRDDTSGTWRSHCSGWLGQVGAAARALASPLAAVRARCSQHWGAREFYASLAAQGLTYGPAFQGVVELFAGPAEALGEVRLVEADGPAFGMHPVLLDGCLQVMMAALGNRAAAGPRVPVAIESVRIHRRLGSRVWSHVQLRGADALQPTRVKGDVRVLDESGEVLVELVGIELQELKGLESSPATRYLKLAFRRAALGELPKSAAAPRLLLLANRSSFTDALRAQLQAPGATVEVQPVRDAAALQRLLKDAAYTAIVHLGSLEEPAGAATSLTTLERTRDRHCGSVLSVVQALAHLGLRNPPRLWLVTRGVHAIEGDPGPLAPAGGMLWGLGRTIAYEHPELCCTRLDLGHAPWSGEVAALGSALLGADREEEVALRESGRFVARLMWAEAAPASSPVLTPAAGRSFQLTIDTPGILAGLNLRETSRRQPARGEVEIEVTAASLNFLDVLTAMGIRPDQAAGPITLGRECAGKIVKLGAGVTGLAVGDPVVALSSSAFASHAIAQARFVVGQPEVLSAEQAAAAPLAFMTAYYALHTLARMKKGERVLIHSASGGTGLAAVQLAQRAGAEVYATAGSPEKREYLRSLGITQVMDSRSLHFADEIMSSTQGRGVDIVLNSLTGAAIEKSLAALGPYGRFIEIGKRDIYDNAPLALGHFRKRLAYFAVDLAAMMDDRPEELAELFRKVMGELGEKALEPLPVTVYPIAEAQTAFRLMAQGGHRGKLVLALADPGARIAVAAERQIRIGSAATYLITGGLGGLGLAVAQWLSAQGARHLLLLGRHGAESAAQKMAVAALEKAGVEVVVARADVAQRGELQAVLHQLTQTMPPLRGVIHAAGSLDDALLIEQDVTRFAKVMAPKVLGAWNLHELTQTRELDFFVLYSSVTALLGSPGQGNYAAANSFLDALAHYRRSLGLPALSINWGAFKDVGLAAAQTNRGDRLAGRGMTGLPPAEGTTELGKLLSSGETQVGVVELELRQWIEFYPQVAASSLLSELVQQSRAGTHRPAGVLALQKSLRTAAKPEQQELLEKYLREQLGQVLQLDPAQIDRAAPFKTLGVDSLLGMELRNRLESGLGLKLSAALIWTYADISRLATHLGGLFTDSPAPPPEPLSAPPEHSPGRSANLDQLSDSELARLGDELLA